MFLGHGWYFYEDQSQHPKHGTLGDLSHVNLGAIHPYTDEQTQNNLAVLRQLKWCFKL